MENTPKIYRAIHEAMEACQAVGKDSRNPQQGYKYRGIDAVMNAINPALRKAGIFCAPEVLETNREERTTKSGSVLIYSTVTVKYSFYAEDGSSITATVIGEGMDSGDKSYNKAMSAAFKYALFQVFCIPTEEMVDSETDSPEPQPCTTAPQRAANNSTGTTSLASNQKPAQRPTGAQNRTTGPLTDGQKAELAELAHRKGKNINFSKTIDYNSMTAYLNGLPDRENV